MNGVFISIQSGSIATSVRHSVCQVGGGASLLKRIQLNLSFCDAQYREVMCGNEGCSDMEIIFLSPLHHCYTDWNPNFDIYNQHVLQIVASQKWLVV